MKIRIDIRRNFKVSNQKCLPYNRCSEIPRKIYDILPRSSLKLSVLIKESMFVYFLYDEACKKKNKKKHLSLLLSCLFYIGYFGDLPLLRNNILDYTVNPFINMHNYKKTKILSILPKLK